MDLLSSEDLKFWLHSTERCSSLAPAN